MSPFKQLLLLLVVLACVRSTVSAQCTSLTTEAQCYSNRTGCHWDLPNYVCATGAPTNTSCYQFYRDIPGCMGSTSDSAGQKCQVNPWNGYCFRPALPCVNITGSDSTCLARSDCRVVSAGVCANATTGPTQYGNAPSACASAGYYYDAFGPNLGKQCYYSLTEELAQFPDCGVWSNYPAPSSDPCVSHGCSWDDPTARCLSLTSSGGVSSGAAMSLVSSFTVDSVSVDIVSQTLTATVTIPIAQFFNPITPRLHVITVGTPAVSRTPLAPSVCNNLAQTQPAFDIGQPRVNPGYADVTGLQSFFLSTVQSTHNLSTFDATTAAGLAIYQTIGYSKIGSTSIVQSVTIPATLDSVKQTVRISLPGAVANCGASITVVAGNYTTYTVPISLTVRQVDNVMVSTMNQFVTVSTYGMVVVGTSTRNTWTVEMDPVVDTAAATAYSAACPAGQKKRTWTIREKWVNPNPNSLVGLRNISDAQMWAFGSGQIPGSPTNCFGTTVKAVSPPSSCTGGVCVTLIAFESRCTPIPADGSGLNLCANQVYANRVADMNGNFPYPSTLDYTQSYYHYPYEWTPGNLNGAFFVGSDVTGSTPDQVAVQIGQSALPDVINLASLAVDCAFLPTPSSNFSMRSAVAGASDSTGAYNIRNTQLTTSGTLTTICYLRNATIRQSFTLTIDVLTTVPANMFRISPLDSRGMYPGYTYPTLAYTDIKNEMTFTPRQISTGVSLPLISGVNSGNIGMDGFSVPAYWLYKLLPSVGYVQQFYVSITLPSVAGSSVIAPTVVSRRLLQVDASGVLSGSTQVGAFSIVPDVNSTNPAAILTTDIGSTKTGVTSAVVVFGTVAAVGTGALAIAFLSAGAASSAVAATAAAAVVAARAKIMNSGHV